MDDERPPEWIAARLLPWYGRVARDLPWRRPDAGPWAVLVSEVMLQQTPVRRVLPVYAAWLERWPTPADLAAETPGEAVRAWGKLGYPRRALRLHACARDLVGRFDGEVPDDVHLLESLPGVGAYTARAVASFAFGGRHPVVDTNVRRVAARAVAGRGDAGPASIARDQAAVSGLLPDDPATAARFGAALMELGATVCTARSPACGDCPLEDRCAWVCAGRPEYDGPRVRPQGFAGTDRQVRGLLMDVVRAESDPVEPAALAIDWPDPAQRDRALASLLADGLLERSASGRYGVPG